MGMPWSALPRDLVRCVTRKFLFLGARDRFAVNSALIAPNALKTNLICEVALVGSPGVKTALLPSPPGPCRLIIVGTTRPVRPVVSLTCYCPMSFVPLFVARAQALTVGLTVTSRGPGAANRRSGPVLRFSLCIKRVHQHVSDRSTDLSDDDDQSLDDRDGEDEDDDWWHYYGLQLV